MTRILGSSDQKDARYRSTGKRVYTGYEPRGDHLGHMVTVNKLMDLEEAGFEVMPFMELRLNRKGTGDRSRRV